VTDERTLERKYLSMSIFLCELKKVLLWLVPRQLIILIDTRTKINQDKINLKQFVLYIRKNILERKRRALTSYKLIIKIS